MTQTKKQDNLVVLFFGDIIGKIGRRALVKILPELRQKYQPDLVIANVENLAHGKGINRKSWIEITDAGVDFATSGNHIFKKPEGVEMLEEDLPLIRPANYPLGTPGRGWRVVATPKGKILMINVLGQLYLEDKDLKPANPYQLIEKILAENKEIKNVIIDFHAEATSEKRAAGLMFDGEVSAVFGSHTHVPTADAQILPKGTAYVTDIGMVGASNSILGGDPTTLLPGFLNAEDRGVFEIPETGVCSINAILLEIDQSTGRAVVCERLDSEIEV